MPDVLFVCSGNTCRSPMAECLFNAVCERRGLPYRAESAGLQAREGDAASDGAFGEMRRRGLSLARHTARPLYAALVNGARLVVPMGESYARVILGRYPQARVAAFVPPVSDPYGGPPSVYRATADDLERRMDWVLAKLEEQP
jgi:protein-tyrosine-phosphatase